MSRLYDWLNDPQRNSKINGKRLNDEFDNIATELGTVTTEINTLTTSVTNLSASVRTRLSTDMTFYVRGDGSDSNNGVADTAGGAFKTIQNAVNVASGYDLGGHNITIQLSGTTPATFTENVVLKTTVGNGLITIKGDSTTPTNFIVTSSAYAVIGASINSDSFVGTYQVDGVKIVGTGGNTFGVVAQNPGAILLYKNINFGACPQQVVSLFAGKCKCNGNITISSGGITHLTAFYGGLIEATDLGGITVTVSGTPAFSGEFALAGNASFIRAGGVTYSGSATGTRYSVTGNSVIDTNGGGANFFPGNAAGSTATGGQYL